MKFYWMICLGGMAASVFQALTFDGNFGSYVLPVFGLVIMFWCKIQDW